MAHTGAVDSPLGRNLPNSYPSTYFFVVPVRVGVDEHKAEHKAERATVQIQFKYPNIAHQSHTLRFHLVYMHYRHCLANVDVSEACM